MEKVEIEVTGKICSEFILALHQQLTEAMPLAGDIKVVHSYVNNVCGEAWECHVYPIKSSDEMLFMIHAQRSPEALIKQAIKSYGKLDMEAVIRKEVARLKARLAQLDATARVEDALINDAAELDEHNRRVENEG